MSVALQSPFTSGTKRLFEDPDSSGEAQQQQQEAERKRVRCLGSPAGRCRPAAHVSPSQHFQPSISAATVAAVKALFPGMDSQVGLLVESGVPVAGSEPVGTLLLHLSAFCTICDTLHPSMHEVLQACSVWALHRNELSRVPA